MSPENLDEVRTAFEAWNPHDWDALMGVLDPEIEWWPSGVFPGLADVYPGREGVRACWNAWTGSWEQIPIEPGGDRQLVAGKRGDSRGFS